MKVFDFIVSLSVVFV